MKIAIDIDGTITANPRFFKRFIESQAQSRKRSPRAHRQRAQQRRR